MSLEANRTEQNGFYLVYYPYILYFFFQSLTANSCQNSHTWSLTLYFLQLFHTAAILVYIYKFLYTSLLIRLLLNWSFQIYLCVCSWNLQALVNS